MYNENAVKEMKLQAEDLNIDVGKPSFGMLLTWLTEKSRYTNMATC